MTYIWSVSDKYPQKMIGFYDEKRSPDRFLLTQGVYLEKKVERIYINFTASMSKLRLYNNLINTSRLPLVDAKICKIFDKYAKFDVQYFDTTIECEDGIIDDYKIVNITHKIFVVDHTQSRYNLMSDGKEILGFKYLVLKPDCLKNHEIARNLEYNPQIIVGQTLFEQFKINKIKAVSLITEHQFNNIGKVKIP